MSAGRITRLQAVGILAIAPALAALAPSPATAWSRLTHLDATGSGLTAASEPLSAALALVAWACSGWLAVAAVTTYGGALPGTLGRTFQRVGRRVAPASVRSLIRLALGGTVALTVLGGTSSAFAEVPPSYDWPGVTATVQAAPTPTAAARTSVPPAAHPTAASTSVPAAAPRTSTSVSPPDRPSQAIVVQPGDSLWAIAARDLGPTASTTHVAQAWPRWWTANHAVVGDDPELIHPGMRLSAPPHPFTSSGDHP